MSGISTRDIFMYRENQKYKWHGKTYFEWRNILLTQKDTSIVYLSSDPANSNDIILVVHYYDDILSVKLNVVAKPN